MKLFNLTIICLFICSISYNQVNTESMRSENQLLGLKNKVSLNFLYFSGNSTMFQIYGEYRLDFKLPSEWNGFIASKYNRAFEKDKEDFRNQAFVHFRIAKLVTKRVDIESFIQKETNNFINLKNRELIGSGIRINHFENLYLGLGIMNEIEKYNDSLREQSYIKSTNYINYIMKISEISKLQNIIYYQFRIKDIELYRILWQCETTINITESFLFHININYRFDSIDDSYFELTNGVVFKF